MSIDYEPIVFWISGRPGDGKTTVSGKLKEKGITVFSTDHFVVNLADNCPDDFIKKQASEYGNKRIGEFLDKMVDSKKGARIANLLLNSSDGFISKVEVPENGTTSKAKVSVIEGYMPLSIQQRIMKDLESRGYRVWVTTRLGQFSSICGSRNWR